MGYPTQPAELAVPPLTQALKATPALRKALERLHEDTARLLPADVFLVGLVGSGGERLHTQALLVDGQAVAWEGLLLSPEAGLSRLVRSQETGLLPPILARQMLGQEWPDGAALASAAPSREGTVVVCVEIRQAAYEPHHQALASLLARQAALQIEKDGLARRLEEMGGEMRLRQEQLDELTQRLMAMEEDQREAWATDVHNSLAPLVFTSAMHLEAFLDTLEEAPEPELARRALDQIRRAGQELRRVIASMGPTSLDVRGVGRVIQDLAQAHARQEDWELTVVDRVGTRAISGAVSNALYRIAEEALNNVRDHAQSSRVDVHLQVDGDDVVLLVRDYGGGLPEGAEVQPGVGVFGMRRRLERLGGELRIGRARGGGLELEARIPLNATG